MNKEINKTQYNFKDRCPYCNEPVAGRLTLRGYKKWEIHKDNCSRPRPRLKLIK